MTALRSKAILLVATVMVAGCSSIVDRRGYIIDETLVQAIQPGIDNRASVETTLGHPSFTSQFGPPTWYYVSSVTQQRPFSTPKISSHSVLAVQFDQSGNVVAADRSGIERVVRLNPESDKTPTLGRERSFLQDLFGNIGQVGTPGMGGGAGGP